MPPGPSAATLRAAVRTFRPAKVIIVNTPLISPFAQALIDALPMPVSIRDAQGTHLAVNAAFREAFRLPGALPSGDAGADSSRLAPESPVPTFPIAFAAPGAPLSLSVYAATSDRQGEAEDMLIAAAHDLRTPLNAMTGWLHLLNHAGTPGPMVDKARQGLARAIQQQLGVVEEMAQMVRAAKGELPLTREQTDLCELVRQLDRPDAADASGSCLTLQLALPGALPVSVDRVLMHSALATFVAIARRACAQPQTLSIGGERRARSAVLSLRLTDGAGARLSLAHVFAPAPRSGGRRQPFRQMRSAMLIRAHGGRLSLDGEGGAADVLLSIYLPLSGHA